MLRNFATIREALGLDLERAAARLNLSPAYLRRLELGRAPLTRYTAARMSQAYGKSISELTRPK